MRDTDPAQIVKPSTIGRLGRESAAYALGGALAKAVNIVLLPVYTAAIPPHEYGVLAALLVVAAFLSPIATLGAGAATGIVYFDRTDEAARGRVVWSAASLALLMSGIVAAAPLLTPERTSTLLFGRPDFAYPTALAFLSVVGSAITQPLMLGIQFRRSVSQYVWISVVSAVLAGLLGLLLVAGLGRGLAGVLEAQLASQFLLLSLSARQNLMAGAPRTDRTAIRGLLRHGLPLVPSFFFLIILQQGNQFLLKELRGLADLGVYVVGYNLGVAMSLLVSGFTTAWLPFFLSFSQNPAAGHEQLKRAMTYYVIGFGCLTLLFFAWARPVVALLAASAFEQAHVVVGYSAAGFFLGGVFSVLLPPLYYAKRVWAVTVIQGVGAIVASCLQVALIMRFGVLGAGIGLASGFLIVCLLLAGWLRLFRETYLRVRYEWTRVIGFGGVIVGGATALSLVGEATLLQAVGWSSAATAVILACGWAALRSDERRAVAAAFRAVIPRSIRLS